jgi:hypothetical protein
MTYWRMQLHPDESEQALKSTVESLSAGYIGLDFSSDVGDLTRASPSQLPENQKNYMAFANEMQERDKVLVFVHHFPFALATVDGEYNYIRAHAPEIGVWFRHFRRVKDVTYFGDVIETDARKWEQIRMTATITPLRKSSTQSWKLIERWLRKIEQSTTVASATG